MFPIATSSRQRRTELRAVPEGSRLQDLVISSKNLKLRRRRERARSVAQARVRARRKPQPK
jgi:hypothetical protein